MEAVKKEDILVTYERNAFGQFTAMPKGILERQKFAKANRDPKDITLRQLREYKEEAIKGSLLGVQKLIKLLDNKKINIQLNAAKALVANNPLPVKLHNQIWNTVINLDNKEEGNVIPLFGEFIKWKARKDIEEKEIVDIYAKKDRE